MAHLGKLSEAPWPVETKYATALLHCESADDVHIWIDWATERRRPFAVKAVEGEIGFRVEITLSDGETVKGNTIVRD